MPDSCQSHRDAPTYGNQSDCRLKRVQSPLESREVSYCVGMLRTRSLGDSISVALRKLLQGGGRGSQAVYKFATKGAGCLNVKDQVSREGTEHSLYGRMQASGLTEFTPFVCTSVAWGQTYFFVHVKEKLMSDSCVLPALSSHCRGR